MSRPEAKVEDALEQAAKAAGGQALKLVSPGLAGVPDRLLIIPMAQECPCCGQNARHAFIEAKAKGEQPEPLQHAVAARLARSGAHVGWVDSKAAAKALVAGLATGRAPEWVLVP